MSGKIILFTITLFSSLAIQAQQLSLLAGWTYGTPISSIPEGTSNVVVKPKLAPYAGLQGRYKLSKKIALSLGAVYTQKGSEFEMDVVGTIDPEEGILGEPLPIPIPFEFDYEASITGEINNAYIDFPLSLHYMVKRFDFNIGYQYSILLDSKFEGQGDLTALMITLEDQTFEESDNIREYDHAITIGGNYWLDKRLAVGGQLSYGFNKILKIKQQGLPDPRNTFGHLFLTFNIISPKRLPL